MSHHIMLLALISLTTAFSTIWTTSSSLTRGCFATGSFGIAGAAADGGRAAKQERGRDGSVRKFGRHGKGARYENIHVRLQHGIVGSRVPRILCSMV